MSTNFVASAAELEVIKQWLKKVTGLNSTVVVEPCLPQSKSFLKIFFFFCSKIYNTVLDCSREN